MVLRKRGRSQTSTGKKISKVLSIVPLRSTYIRALIFENLLQARRRRGRCSCGSRCSAPRGRASIFGCACCGSRRCPSTGTGGRRERDKRGGRGDATAWRACQSPPGAKRKGSVTATCKRMREQREQWEPSRRACPAWQRTRHWRTTAGGGGEGEGGKGGAAGGLEVCGHTATARQLGHELLVGFCHDARKSRAG